MIAHNQIKDCNNESKQKSGIADTYSGVQRFEKWEILCV